MLIKEALSILTATNEKIQLLGVEVVDSDLQDSPKLPRLQTQLNQLVMRYTMLLQHIVLNDDGDEILDTIGENDSDLNKILIDLQELANLNDLPGLPIPRTTYITTGSGGGGLPGSGSLGDLLYHNGSAWVNFNRGASGEVLVSTPTTIQWQSIVGNGIPSGGSAGQFLRKNTNDDYDAIWANALLSDLGVTASSDEVNVLDGITASTVELNLLTGLTGGSLQSQLAGKLSNSLATSNMWVGNGGGVATAVDTSSAGDILAHSVDGLTIKSGVIINADVSTSAAIARSKLAAGSANRLVINDASGVMDVALGITANRALVSNSLGIPVASTVTDVKLAFVDATSSIQTQLNNRLSFSSAIAPAEGDMIYFNGTTWVNLAVGTNGQLLSSDGTNPQWVTDPPTGLPSGGSAAQILRKIDGTDYNAEWHTLVTADLTDILATFTELNQLSGVSVTPTQFNTLQGIDSNIQDQLDGKLGNALAYNAIYVGNGSGLASQLASGTNGYVLTIVGSTPTWQPATPPGDVSGPVSSTDRAIATWNGTAGDALRDTSVLIDASNNITGVASLSGGQIDVLNQAELRLHETGSTNYVGIRATGVMAGNYTITLPAAAPAGNTFLKYDGADYVWAAGGGGASNFTDLGDVPSAYTGEGGKGVFVKAAEDGLEFLDSVVSISGTTNRITISGTASVPIIDIAATYVGQASITTLGTIATGVWSGTNISLAKGGTGSSLADPGADRIMFWDESGNVIDWLSIDSTLSISGTVLSSVFGDEQAQDAVGNILGNTTTINLIYDDGTPEITAIVNDNSISNTKIRQSVALSVMGRSANSTGDVADIAAGSDFNILRRSGTAIGFGAIDLSQAGAVGTSILPIANGGTGSATFPGWLAASGVAMTANNTISGAFNIGFTNTAFGIGVAPGSITANTTLDVRGSGGGTNLIQRWADGATLRASIKNNGQFWIESQADDVEGLVYGTAGTRRISLLVNQTTATTYIQGYGNSGVEWKVGTLAAGQFGFLVNNNNGGFLLRNSTSDTTLTAVLNLLSGSVANSIAPANSTKRAVVTSSVNFVPASGGNADISFVEYSGNWTAGVSSFTTATMRGIWMAPTISQTLGTGTFIGFDYSPPSVTGLLGTHLAWRNTSGRLLFGGSSITAGVFMQVTQAVSTSGTPTALLFNGAAHTTIAASTEAIDINYNLARTVEFSTGALATQRAFVIQAPTYGFVGSSTITDAFTFSVTGAPALGTNATITNAWAAGFGGNVTITGNNRSSAALRILGTYTTSVSDQAQILLVGAITMRATSADEFSFIANGQLISTGATNQQIRDINSEPVLSINHTGVTVYGYDWNPQVGGTQTPVIVGVRVVTGSVNLFNAVNTFGGGVNVMKIGNAQTDASSAEADAIILQSRNSSDGNATLALYTEQVPEASVVFVQSHRVKVWWNNAEYWMQLDAV